MLSISRMFEAYLDDMNLVTILVPYSYFDGKSTSFSLCFKNDVWDMQIKEMIHLEEHMKYLCETNVGIEFGKTYKVKDERGTETDLQIGAVIRTQRFDELFYYEGNDLGANIMANGTQFKLWAPTATAVRVRYKSCLTSKEQEQDLERQENGVWALQAKRDLEGYYYRFLVCINLNWQEAVDPYAKSLSANSEWGVIVDMHKTLQLNSPPPPFASPTEAIIYEVHIRDFTSHPNSGVMNKGKYVGLNESETKTDDGYSTGFTYLNDLGITHVELLPVNDFFGVDELNPSKQYNWGYNPLFFNVPEGSYATNPTNPYQRINELKQVIQHYHSHDLRVILDVVYNHVYIQETSSFEKTAPGYFFRHDAFGLPSDGTGVGNDFASERLMARKFIVDSIVFWLKEYKVDGFRFDLMGNLDLETMKRVKHTVETIHSGALLLGEGWDLPTTLPLDQKATSKNAAKLAGVSFFHDIFRDAVKGSTFYLMEPGYALGKWGVEKKIVSLLTGNMVFENQRASELDVSQTVNYVESHDNHTLWDKIIGIFPDEPEFNKRRHRLATCLVLLSQGTPFLHGGQEFFRTKKGVENSYNSPDNINWFDWTRRVEHDDNIQYIKSIISLRKHQKAFQFHSIEQIQKHITVLQAEHGIVALHYHHIEQYGPWEEMIVVFHSGSQPQKIQLPKGKWHVIANDKKAALTPFEFNVEHEVTLAPFCVNIFCGK
ncbi:type I pullulanase [Bacillus sp. 2205SS5-2]|uniref:type I pullulanase n=1 Tax=Bacillus sp. 2205SS5-2 TaxID=3109031 RepID=UPI0030052A71